MYLSTHCTVKLELLYSVVDGNFRVRRAPRRSEPVCPERLYSRVLYLTLL